MIRLNNIFANIGFARLQNMCEFTFGIGDKRLRSLLSVYRYNLVYDNN
jgi:hypothetical protein